MKSHDIVDLVDAAQAGCRESFGQLVERHQAMVYAVCYRIAGNPADAEDLAHDAFVEAFLKLRQLVAPERFSGWLRTVARNICLMWLRRRVSFEELEEEPATPIEDEPDEACVQAAAAMADLPVSQRLILVLHYWERMSYQEISRFLDVPMGTVMSRMHRARAALRERMDDVEPDEDMVMNPETDFREEVDAEIAVLLRMSRHDGKSLERLRPLIEHSPERLTELIRDTDDPALLRALGRAMWRLGTQGFEPILAAYTSSEPETRARAFTVLEASLRRSGDQHVSVLAHLPPQYAYLLADAIVAANMGDDDRADLLVDLLEVCTNNSNAGVLLACVLMCYRAEASRVLLERFRGITDPGELYRQGHVFYALLRTGPALCAELVTHLAKDDGDRLLVSLAAAEGLARCLDHQWLQDVSPEQYVEDQRRRIKFAALRSEEFPPGLLEELKEQLCRLVEHPDPQVRNRALRVLGHLRDHAFAASIRAAASHEDSTTRVEAVKALGELGDVQTMDTLLQAAQQEERAVRVAAIEALSRLKLPEAKPVLSELVRDPDQGVRAVAVIALGELTEGDDDSALRELLRSGDKPVAKAAARALYKKGRGAPEPSERSLRLAELRAKRDQKVRGEATLVTHQDADAALRFAFPEIRAYAHNEVTHRIARVCGDYSGVRRALIMWRFMTREQNVYEFTELGKAAWRVEHLILDRYLMPKHA